MRPTSTNLTSSPWAQPARTPTQAEEAELEVDEQARLIRVGADPIHHQPPQPGHLGGQGQVVARRYCRKSSRLMSARRGMSTITFPRWASFSALGRSERAAAVGRLTELQHRQLWGGRECRTGRGPGPACGPCLAALLTALATVVTAAWFELSIALPQSPVITASCKRGYRQR